MSTPNPEREKLARVIEAGWGDPTWDGKTLRPIDRKIADAVLAAGYRPQAVQVDAKRQWCAMKHAMPCHHWFEDECSDECERGEHNHPINSPDCTDRKSTNAALATTGGETEWETPHCHTDEFGTIQHSVNCECWGPKDGPLVKRRAAGPWVAVDPTSPETTERGK